MGALCFSSIRTVYCPMLPRGEPLGPLHTSGQGFVGLDSCSWGTPWAPTQRGGKGETTRRNYQTKPIAKMGQLTCCGARGYEKSRGRKLGCNLGYKDAWEKGGENGAQSEQKTRKLHNVR